MLFIVISSEYMLILPDRILKPIDPEKLSRPESALPSSFTYNSDDEFFKIPDLPLPTTMPFSPPTVYLPSDNFKKIFLKENS